MRVGFCTKTEDARNSGSLRKLKPRSTLHAVLLFVGPDKLLVRELVRREHIGRDEEGGFALHRASDRLVRDGDRRLDLPLRSVGRGVLARPSWSALFGMRDEIGLHREPLRTLLELLHERRLRSGRAGEALIAQVP
jgi:hypothetical protein